MEKIVKREVIAYTRKVRGRNKGMGEPRCFVKWNGCSEDENTWELRESLHNPQDLVEEFHWENLEMRGRADVE